MEDNDVTEAWERFFVEDAPELISIFTKHGFSKDSAIICYFLNVMTNALTTNLENNKEDEDWKNG